MLSIRQQPRNQGFGPQRSITSTVPNVTLMIAAYAVGAIRGNYFSLAEAKTTLASLTISTCE
ncbi:hypothetical protein PMI11_06908 [Rhizobium sp. CF142]|nr:hypothetical protein PMI11_06908 [Rhizobium sp. CF142]